MVSSNLLNNAAAAAGYDVVHVNSEFIDQASDHDPQLVQLTMPAPTISASASPAANAAGWNKTAVTVSFTCVDPLSAIVGGCPAPVDSRERRCRPVGLADGDDRGRALALGRCLEHRHRPHEPDGDLHRRQGELRGRRAGLDHVHRRGRAVRRRVDDVRQHERAGVLVRARLAHVHARARPTGPGTPATSRSRSRSLPPTTSLCALSQRALVREEGGSCRLCELLRLAEHEDTHGEDRQAERPAEAFVRSSRIRAEGP